MYFELSVAIARPPSDVFAFLRDKDLYPQQADSPVLALEKTTVGAASVGTRYREVVQMLPFARGEMLSQITRFEPPRYLEEDFHGAGMRGHLAYEFVPDGDRTVLISRVLPVVRTFISLPAGVARMNVWRFSILSFVGSFPWSLGLAWAGFLLGENWERIRDWMRPADYPILIVLGALVAWYVYRRVRTVFGQPEPTVSGSKE